MDSVNFFATHSFSESMGAVKSIVLQSQLICFPCVIISFYQHQYVMEELIRDHAKPVWIRMKDACAYFYTTRLKVQTSEDYKDIARYTDIQYIYRPTCHMKEMNHG